MKILYYSDKYTYNVMGTKRSLFEEIQSRGIPIIWKDKSLLGQVLLHIQIESPTQIWLASSDALLSSELKSKIQIPVVAFGFSDPFMFSLDRLCTCDVYVTNHHGILSWHKHKVSMVYNPVACDFKFHKRMDVDKKFDISIIGCANHCRFKNPNKRVEIVNRLRDDGFDIWAFGNNWPKHQKNKSHIEAQEFLDTINLSKIGLDIMGESFPLAHRMFEYSACGVPVVTKHRSEVFSFFKEDEIKIYTDYESLKTLLSWLLKDNHHKNIGTNALHRCQKDHNISNRVDHLLTELERLI